MTSHSLRLHIPQILSLSSQSKPLETPLDTSLARALPLHCGPLRQSASSAASASVPTGRDGGIVRRGPWESSGAANCQGVGPHMAAAAAALASMAALGGGGGGGCRPWTTRVGAPPELLWPPALLLRRRAVGCPKLQIEVRGQIHAARASGQGASGAEVDAEADGRVSVDSKVWITLIEAELDRGNDLQAVSLARNLRAFGKAATVPQRIYTLEDLRLNKIDASKFLSPVDSTLGTVRRNLQLALLLGGAVLWRTLDLNMLQVLGVVVIFLFIGTLDQVANGGGGEALLLDTLGRQLSQNYKDRVAQHEAGHFLISYLMGILPKSYTLSSIEAYQRYRALNVQAGTMFVDMDFQEEVAKGKVSAGTLDKVSCIALAGVATEYVLYGMAEGGLADIKQLDDLMRGLGFTQRKADGQVRWAVLNTVTLLRRHKGLHSKLAAAMSFGKTVAECIGLIESELANVSYI